MKKHTKWLRTRLVEILASFLNLLPIRHQNKFFEIVLRFIPIPLLKLIPCSYSAYIKQYMPQRGDVIIDCGAHIGNCTILFSRLVGKSGTVIAVEPFEVSFRILKERTKNLKCKITLINKAVWDKNTKIPLKVFDNTVSCRIVDDNHSAAGPDIKMIDCIAIDDLVAEINPERLNMIKMDIEGAEIEALKGSVNTIEKYSPRFAVASYHKRNTQKTCYWVENFLNERGYSTKTFFLPHLTTYGEIRG
ncbi:MAG: FkbM family methyltransferase [Desulfatiglans sp.]|nr:FkbM family methyltransferase [Desulfatiglans sp.]